MLKWKVSALMALGGGVLALAVTYAQQTNRSEPAKGMALTANDYIEIQQLVNRYAFALDTCANNGYDYADLYSPDGVFISGRDGTRYQGRERLAEAAGGGKRGCKILEQNLPQSHTTVNLVIDPSPEGARGKSYLVYPGVQGKVGDADHAGHVGGYEDIYVKTPQGWRFKQRIHVYPPQIPGAYTGVPRDKQPVQPGSSR